MIEKTLQEIAQLINGKVVGDSNLKIKGINGIKEATSGEITFLANPKYLPELETTRASAVIVSSQIKNLKISSIQVENPYFSFARTIELFYPQEAPISAGIHKTAIIANDVKLGKNIAIGPYVVIEDGVELGDGAVVYPGVYIGRNTKIGPKVLIYANVSIREKIIIGNNVIIHSGTVIGSDGFGFIMQQGKHHKIPQVGIVEIGDEVEIGANVSIDRGTIGATRIGRGTKIDNLVQIAHNVQIGENCIIIAQVGIAGSTVIEDNVTLAGQAGIIGHITVGKGSIVAAQAGVTKDVAPGECVSGYPAQPHKMAKRIHAEIQKLPELYQKIKELEKRIEELEKERSKD